MPQIDPAERLQQKAKASRSKYKFLATRMWINTAISAIWSDIGSIPKDIGSKLLIGNNMIASKNGLRGYIVIDEWSHKTPVSVTTALTKHVKSKVPEIQIDVSFKCRRFVPDLGDPALKASVNIWERVLNNQNSPAKEKERAARLMYTYERMKTQEPMFKVVTVIMITANRTTTLRRAIKFTLSYLKTFGTEVRQIKADINMFFESLSVFINRKFKKTEAIPWLTYSAQTLSETLPVTQGMSADQGVFMGIDRRNRGPFYRDFRRHSGGKVMYIIAQTGTGKTFLQLNWIFSAFAQGYKFCIMDLKGDEFRSITLACGGLVLSMKPDSSLYVNTFRLDPNRTELSYYKEQLRLSKTFLSLICDFTTEERLYGEAFLEEFLKSMYLALGVSGDNCNTWHRTQNVGPAYVYQEFKRYLSNDVRNSYGRLLDKISMSFETYLSPKGTSSGLFEKEFSMPEILKAPCVCFDYGILDGNRVSDPVTFRLKMFFMGLLNDMYIANNKANKEWTWIVLEESQFITEDPFLLQQYKDTITLRRAQNCVVSLLGNSVATIANSPGTRALFENITMLVCGKVPKTSREILIAEFGLDDERQTLEDIYKKPEFSHTFLFVDRSTKATNPLLEVFVPSRVASGKVFKNVDTRKDDEPDA